MKTLIKFSFVAAMLGASQANAQTTGDKIKHDAKVAGDKTANVAANGAAVVVDKKYDGKYGPYGEAIYINKNSHYYYINKKGHRVYLKKSELRDHK